MIRFFNGRTLTMADGVSVTTDEVWTDGDKIAYIGPTPETLPAFERQIDLGGDLVMPGFKNAHAHAGMSFVRSYADDVPLQPWLFEQIFPLEAKLTPEAVYAFTKLSILEYLTSGITAGFDMYYFREAIAQASIDCGFRTVLCGGGGSAQQLESEYRKFNALHPLISYQLGLHSEYTSNLTEMTEAGELARALHAPVFAHNAETAREVAECRGRWGKTPTELFEYLGHYDYGGGGFHCVHMTEHDLEIFRNRGLWAVTNPGSNAKLASGIAPLKQMRALGIHMAIGTDGPSSNNALDFFREMYLAAVLQKLRCGDAAALPADDVLHMATVGENIRRYRKAQDLSAARLGEMVDLTESAVPMGMRDAVEAVTQQASERLRAQVDGVLRSLMNEKRVSLLPEVHPGDQIVQYAKDNSCDLIIMGSRGLGALRGMLGSVSSYVLREATVPVLVVKAGE